MRTVCARPMFSFFFCSFLRLFSSYPIMASEKPGCLLLFDPRAIQGSVRCRCRHPVDEGLVQLRIRRCRGRKMTKHDVKTTERRQRKKETVDIVLTVENIKPTKFLLIVR